jgi:hypothetical protein
MKILFLPILAALALAGCNSAESPAEVSQDVRDARRDAAQEVNVARRDASDENAAASREVADQRADSAAVAAKGAYAVAVAEAEGDHKIAIEKCEALAGAEQQVCKDRADGALESATARASTLNP